MTTETLDRGSAPALEDAMVPVPYRVVDRRQENRDTATLELEPVAEALPLFAGGQFTMLYAFGVGEAAISISGDPGRGDGRLTQTIREVGAVSSALQHAAPGTVIGARGPFGVGWDVTSAAGHDLVIVAGGLGLAPLRPVILEALAARRSFGRVVIIAGAREPADFLFRDELTEWSSRADVEFELTVDAPAADWSGSVGFVTEPLRRLWLNAYSTTAFLCGPEPMIRFSAEALANAGVPTGQIRVSLERHMKCGVALCGHCQLGPLLLCRDGPVVTYDVAAPLLRIREL
jgi:NAD(P)H-flavin reductase